MARIRTIKPEMFRHEELYEAERTTGLPLRLAFAGMFTVADREGRFKWQPRVIKLDVLPFDEVDFSTVMDALAEHGFIVKYSAGADTFGYIPSWAKHQHINQREAASVIPAPDEAGARTCENIPAHGEGKGREEEGKGNGSTAAPPKLHERLKAIQPELFAAAGLGANPSPALINVSPILELIDKGYDFAKDILPVVREVTARGTKPTTWKYFVSAIVANKAKNDAIPPKATSPPGKAVTWVQEDDPLFRPLAERYRTETGKPISPRGSRNESGLGAYFYADWVSEKSEAA